MWQAKWLGAALLAALLGACTTGYDIEKLRTAEPQGSAFTEALTAEYRDFTVSEADAMYDWIDADYFARKGLEASRGVVVEPEPVGAWDLPGDKVAELTNARATLTALLADGARDRAPAQAARAQGAFDCWMEQQEENHQPTHIARCRDAFHDAVAEIEAAMAPQPEAEMEAEPEVETEPTAEELAAVQPETFTVYFAFDSTEIRPEAVRTIGEAAAAAREGRAVQLSLTGHADRAGPEEYNMRLSLRRAQAVRDVLVERGIAAERISLAARGESEPAVPTADGVREPANRRVEIVME